MDLKKVKLLREKINQLEYDMSWRMKEEVGCCGITLAQAQILAELGKTKEVCIVNLADALGIDSSTLSRTANRMVEAGLIDRITNCSDRRYVSLTLTDKGHKLYETIENKCNDYYTEIFELVPEEKREQVIESFTLFTEALKAYKEHNE
ncbi:MAG: winged helix-turn-helix transcriptional regulator [Clostridia bacterium]|jgi:DNA-binding MarR family transcriptional regulator|nr:winged helix-turn-helix transcriptional regulator [Clostridia bacterium]